MTDVPWFHPSPSLSRPMPITAATVAHSLRDVVFKALDENSDSVLLGTSTVSHIRMLDPLHELLSEHAAGPQVNCVLTVHQAWRLLRALERRAVKERDLSAYAFTVKTSDYGTRARVPTASEMFDFRPDPDVPAQRGPDLVLFSDYERERDLVNRWVLAAQAASGRLGCRLERSNPEAWAGDQATYVLGLLDRLKAQGGMLDDATRVAEEQETRLQVAAHDLEQSRQVAERRAKRLEGLELLERAIRGVVLSAPLTDATA